MKKDFVAEIVCRDKIQITEENAELKIFARGSLSFLKEVEKLRKKLSDRDSAREYLKTLVNKDSNSLLLKELLQKYLGECQPSYTEKELCHCRAVDTDLVIDSIYLGANDIEKIGKMCSAGTSCGTCQPDSLNLLQDFS